MIASWLRVEFFWQDFDRIESPQIMALQIVSSLVSPTPFKKINIPSNREAWLLVLDFSFETGVGRLSEL